MKDYLKKFYSTPWDQLQFFSKKFSDQQVRFVIYLNGLLDVNILKLAIQTSLKVVPILSCQFQEKYYRPKWQQIPDLSINSIFSVHETLDPDVEIQKSLVKEINPLTGPIFFVDLIRSNSDSICINLDHTAGDGSSVIHYAYLLASLYRDLQKDINYFPESNLNISRGFKPILYKVKLKERIRLIQINPSHPKPEINWQFPWKKGVIARNKRILIRRMTNETSSNLLQFSDSSHSWPNDIILAAYFRALNSVIPPFKNSTLSIRVPIDMRAYLSVHERGQIANLSSSFDVVVPQIGDNFSETLSLVVKQMEKSRWNYPGMALILKLIPFLKVLPYRFIKRILFTGKIKIPSPPPWLVQMGTILPGKLAFGEVKPIFAFPLQSVGRSPGLFQLGVSRFANTFTFSVCFFGDDEESQIVGQFLDYFVNEISQLKP